MSDYIFSTKKDNTTTKNLAVIFVKICVYFISALFIWWGWNVLAPHLNAPLFNYWEVFAMRMAFSSIAGIFWQK
jgi:TRAP-type C4-dicarboxylate transport system permease small subunit